MGNKRVLYKGMYKVVGSEPNQFIFGGAFLNHPFPTLTQSQVANDPTVKGCFP